MRPLNNVGLLALLVLVLLCVNTRWLARVLTRWQGYHSTADLEHFDEFLKMLEDEEAEAVNRQWREVAALASIPPPSPPVRTAHSAFMAHTRQGLQMGTYILPTLLPRVKRAIDAHHGLSAKDAAFGRRWPSCAIVGNSGTLLNAEYGHNISQHAAVWRLNLAPTTGVAAHVGVRTHVSFINGHRLHWCAREAGQPAPATASATAAGASRDQRPGSSAQPVPCAACFPYGHNVPVLTNLWEPFHYEDLAYCRTQRPAEQVVVMDKALHDVCTAVVDAYAHQRVAEEDRAAHEQGNPPLARRARWRAPDYSTGMMAVVVALTMCDQVSLYGFGKLGATQHHYFENRTKVEYGYHDYSAEQLMYRDLVSGSPVHVLSDAMQLPPVAIF